MQFYSFHICFADLTIIAVLILFPEIQYLCISFQ